LAIRQPPEPCSAWATTKQSDAGSALRANAVEAVRARHFARLPGRGHSCDSPHQVSRCHVLESESRLQLRDLQTGQAKGTVFGEPVRGGSGAVVTRFLPRSRVLTYWYSADSLVQVWNSETGEKEYERKDDRKEAIQRIAVASDGASSPWPRVAASCLWTVTAWMRSPRSRSRMRSAYASHLGRSCSSSTLPMSSLFGPLRKGRSR